MINWVEGSSFANARTSCFTPLPGEQGDPTRPIVAAVMASEAFNIDAVVDCPSRRCWHSKPLTVTVLDVLGHSDQASAVPNGVEETAQRVRVKPRGDANAQPIAENELKRLGRRANARHRRRLGGGGDPFNKLGARRRGRGCSLGPLRVEIPFPVTKRAFLDANLLSPAQPAAHGSMRFTHSSRRAMRDHVAQVPSLAPKVLVERIRLSSILVVVTCISPTCIRPSQTDAG